MNTNLKRLRHVFALHRVYTLLLLLGFIMSVSGCALSRNPITGEKRPYAYTWSQERQLGAQADQQIVSQYGIVDDAQLHQYVEQVGQRVLAESHLRRPDTPQEFRETPFTFRVLDSPVVNAFALPGGYVYVTRGLLAHMENEAQLAVVLGHEIGHVAARHASERAFETQLGQLGVIGAAILGQEVLGLPAGDLLQLGSQAAQLLFLRYSRGDESESDELGVEYAARAGYKASEGAAFFTVLKRLQEVQGGGLPTFLSTHPDPGQREQRIIQLAQQFNSSGQQIVGQEELYRAIDNMIVGENPRLGFTEEGVFYHPDLRFKFPVPPDYYVQNQATQVGLIEPNQQAVLVLTLSEAGNVRDAAGQITQQQGIQVAESGQATINGMPAYYVVADAQTQQGQNVRLLYYAIEYNNNIYVFVGYSAAETFSRYADVFLRTIRGFEPVTDRRILNVEPVRINIQNAQRTAPFAEFIPSSLAPQLSPEEVAIMNQVQLRESIPAGTPLKLPR